MCLYGFVKLSDMFEWCMNNDLKINQLYTINPEVWISPGTEARAKYSVKQFIQQYKDILSLYSSAVTCLSETNESADVTECMRWAGPMPPLVQECLVPCKDDCTFTPWSKFTACSFDCESTKTRRRSLTGIIFYNIYLVMMLLNDVSWMLVNWRWGFGKFQLG